MNENFMKEKPVFPLLMSMALPMVISMMVNALYNIVDSFFVAKISEDAMTALSYVFPLQNFVNAVAIGFGVGINAVIAIYLGAKDNERADRAASWGMFLAVIQGIVMTVVCIAIIPSFLIASCFSRTRDCFSPRSSPRLSCWFCTPPFSGASTGTASPRLCRRDFHSILHCWTQQSRGSSSPPCWRSAV